MSSSNRVAFVTGGAYGIGRATARCFAQHEYAVMIADIDTERARKLESELRAEGREALYLQVNVRDEAQVRRGIEQTLATWGRLDALCNNAGIEVYRRAEEFTSEDWSAMVDTDLRGPFLCSKYAYPALRKTRGCIINIASVQGIACEPRSAVYAAAKAGLLALTRGMALDFASAGVRVNAICPGAVLSGMMESHLALQTNPSQVLEGMARAIPLGRLGEPEDIARAAYFLASPDAAYITGATLVVDGGLLAKLAI